MYHLVSWQIVCQPKEQGGLGLVDLTAKNISYLGKWIWRLEHEDGLWQRLLRNKYVKKGTLGQCGRKTEQSQF